MKKHILKKVLCILLFVFCMMGTVSCKERPDSNISSELHTSSVISKDGILEYGDYIFFDSIGKGIYRYNRTTGEVSSACSDAECDGNCILEAPLVFFSQIHDGKLFFASMMAYVHDYSYAYLDLITGNVTVLRTFSEVESTVGISPIVENGYCYYNCKILKENGVATNPNDYMTYICRISIDSKREEFLYDAAGESEQLLFVHNGKLITLFENKIYLITPNCTEKTILFDINKEGYSFLAGDISYLNGKLFFLVKGRTEMLCEYRNRAYKHSFLVSVDVESGVVEKVVEAPVVSFRLSENEIYYAPFELRYLYIPEDYQNHPDKVVVCMSSADLHCCNLDGSNDQIVYSNAEVMYAEIFTVIDGVLYGQFDDYNDKTKAWNGDYYFGKADFSTKELKKVKYEKN